MRDDTFDRRSRRPWILVPVLPVMLVIALIASSAQFLWSALRHLAKGGEREGAPTQ